MTYEELVSQAAAHPWENCVEPSFDGLASSFSRLPWESMEPDLQEALLNLVEAPPGSQLWRFEAGQYRLPGPGPAAELVALAPQEGAVHYQTDRFHRRSVAAGDRIPLEQKSWFWLGPAQQTSWWCYLEK